MRGLIVSFIALCLLGQACTAVDQDLHIHFGDTSLYTRPRKLPDDLPQNFLYKKEPVLMAGNYGSGRYGFNRQGIMIQQSQDSIDDILQYYQKLFAREDWQIIQSVQNSTVHMLMAESPSRRLVTVVLRGEAPVQIKIYNKPGNLL